MRTPLDQMPCCRRPTMPIGRPALDPSSRRLDRTGRLSTHTRLSFRASSTAKRPDEDAPIWRQPHGATAPVKRGSMTSAQTRLYHPCNSTSGAVLAGDPSIQSVDDLAQSRSRSLALSSTARFESVETDALVGSLAYDR
jgi:hypothetical protein